MEDNENMETTSESVETVETSDETKVEDPKKEEKTFTRDEVNKMINAEKIKERKKVLEEVETEKQKAEKLAKMDEDQKMQFQLNEALERAKTAEQKLNARDLENEALKQAGEKGIPLELVKTLDFEKETAESIFKKLEVFENTAKKVRETTINEYSKEKAPQTGDKVTPEKKAPSSYSEWVDYYKEHPNEN